MGADMRSFYPSAGAQTAFFLKGSPGTPGSQSVLGNVTPQKGDTARSPSRPGNDWVATGIAGYGSGPSGGQTMTWRYDGPAEKAAAPAPPAAAAPAAAAPAPSGGVGEDYEPGPRSLEGGKKLDKVESDGALAKYLDSETDYDKWLQRNKGKPTEDDSTGGGWDRYFRDEVTTGKPMPTEAKDSNDKALVPRMAGSGDFYKGYSGIISNYSSKGFA